MRKRLRKLKTIADLTFDDKNANRGTDRGRQLVNYSLEQYGAGRSVLTDRAGKLIAGNKTVEQARAAGMKIRVVPTNGRELVVVQRTDLDMDQDKAARELAIADNRAGELGLDWDPEMLELLRDQGVTLDAMFDQAELDELINSAMENGAPAGEDETAVAEMIERAAALDRKWKVKRGQLWSIGRHRLLCGDCTSAKDVDRLMDGNQADLVFTDPPYNLGSENDLIAASVSPSIAKLKASAWDRNFVIRPALDQILRAVDKDVSIYVASSHHLIPEIWQWMKEFADYFGWCAWHKPNPTPSLSKRQWTWAAELIAYATRGKHTFNFPAEGHASNVWTIAKNKVTDLPAEKTIDVPIHAIAHSSKKNDLVIDFFLGSGTTMVAAESLNRICFAMDIDPHAIAVALERISIFNPHLRPQKITLAA
jgi:DNA modification methylase